ncbi:MAG: thioredoxin domain-containing protein [Bacteroidota bacterium]
MSSNLIIDVKRNLLSNYVKKTKLPIVADFWAPWCGPCSRFKPTIEALAKHFAGKLQILKVNIDENDDTAEAYQIVNIPTLIIFNAKGVRIQTIKGQKTLPQLIQALEALPIF